MLVKGPAEDHMLALCLGTFPRNTDGFVDSSEYFDQIVFVDYKLHLLIENELALNPRKEAPSPDQVADSLAHLIEHASSFNANYSNNSKSYPELLYYTVVMAHLHYLNSAPENMHAMLTFMSPSPSYSASSVVESDFVDYLHARYYALLGLSNAPNAHSHWVDYLVNLKKYGLKSQIAANKWHDTISSSLLYLYSSNGSKPLRFSDVANQPFGENPCAIVAFSNYCLRADHEKYVDPAFKEDYTEFLSVLLNNKIKQKIDFPDALTENSSQNDFVDTLYETLNANHINRRGPKKVLSSRLSKTFLINMMEKTYQSFTVLSNYVRTLIDLDEYDEALAAFKTYIDYIEKDQQQNHGYVDNILEIIDVYTYCLLHFTPSYYMVHDAHKQERSRKRFQYNSVRTVVDNLKVFEAQLVSYLAKLASVAGLSYDQDVKKLQDNKLSFLFHKYNPTMVSKENSKFVTTVAKAWYVLGDFHAYLAAIESPNQEIMQEHSGKLLFFYKNSLIVNTTGSIKFLFRYALELAYQGHVDEAIILSKFTLKKFPESFRTWNLLVLLVSALENEANIDDTTVPAGTDTSAVLDGLKETSGSPAKKTNANLENFVEDALNIAAVYLTRCSRNRTPVSLQTKYSILQLKMTQLAVWEAKHGIEYILEYIAEVFVLYRQLFGEGDEPGLTGVSSRADNRWSHRPSVIDPTDAALAGGEKPKEAHHNLKDRTKMLTRISSRDVRASKEKLKPTGAETVPGATDEARILQEIWLWSASIYMRIGQQKEAEECITEAETVAKPSVNSFTFLGLLTSKSRKFLSLQEFERSLELFSTPEEQFNKKSYANTLLGLCKLFILDDETETNSLFISNKDLDSGLIRLKNYLEEYSACWPYGNNSVELWYYLSIIYERFDDKVLLHEALWKCVELDRKRPVRAYSTCEEWM